jgi:hypothetical protein
MKNDRKPERLQVSTDGELPDLDALISDQGSQPEAAPIYCTQCGTANIAHATYCRKCGQALALQEIRHQPRLPPVEAAFKRKNEALAELSALKPGPEATNLWGMVLRVSTMLWIAGMIITALVVNAGNSAWVAIPVALAWIIVEAVRGPKVARISLWDMISSNVTALFAAGMVITSLVVGGGSSAWVSLPILLIWASVEAIRGG